MRRLSWTCLISIGIWLSTQCVNLLYSTHYSLRNYSITQSNKSHDEYIANIKLIRITIYLRSKLILY
jgi:hypothetical protein